MGKGSVPTLAIHLNTAERGGLGMAETEEQRFGAPRSGSSTVAVISIPTKTVQNQIFLIVGATSFDN